MAIQQNSGSPVPKGGVTDNRKYDMSLKLALGGGGSSLTGGTGTGSGIKGGGTLGGKGGKKPT
jgi:hypothetical protein